MKKRWVAALFGIALICGCSPGPVVGKATQPVQNGTLITFPDPSVEWFLFLYPAGTFCSGVLLNRYYGLTAAHCVARASGGTIDVLPLDAIGRVDAFSEGSSSSSDVAAVLLHPDIQWISNDNIQYDAALLQFATPIDLPHFPRFRMPVELNWAIGDTVDVYGQGIDGPGDVDNGTEALRTAPLMISAYNGSEYAMPANAENQELSAGDSGGPSMARTGTGPALVGIHEWIQYTQTQNTWGYDLPLSAGRTITVNDWIIQTLGIQIDATGLWPQQISTPPLTTWFDSTHTQQVAFQPGTYTISTEYPLYYRQMGSPVIGTFTIEQNGTVSYSATYGDVFSGAGTDTLIVKPGNTDLSVALLSAILGVG
jgi:hypothetical protein